MTEYPQWALMFQVNLPVFGTIHPQSNKFVMSVLEDQGNGWLKMYSNMWHPWMCKIMYDIYIVAWRKVRK